MADEDKRTVTLMFFKEQVERWAAKKRHNHVCEDITDISQKYSKTPHASRSNTYGVGDSEYYGHVKVDTSVNNSSSNPVENKAISTAITNAINGLRTELKGVLQEKIYFVTEHLEEWENDKIEDVDKTIKYAVPTAKAVYDTIKNYHDLFRGRSLDMPKDINASIDTITEPGYYHETGNFNFSYGGEIIWYANGLIKVEKQNTRVIQHVYATYHDTTQSTYRLSGAEYTRIGVISNTNPLTVNWSAWHVAHQPYTKTTRAVHIQGEADPDSIVVYENTAGFIIHWDQTNAQQNRYPITAPLYEYKTICEFNPSLPIKGPYVFGNLIGRFDIKITSDKMQIRSNVTPGGRIIEMHETYFVPRNQ